MAVTELVTPVGNLTDSGTIAFTDVDLTDMHSIDPTITASAGALGTLTASVSTDTAGGLGGVIGWNYSVTASAVEYLAKDQTKVESFTITLDDGHGGTITKQIDVTITGTDQRPVANNDTNWAKEDTSLTAQGNVLNTIEHNGAPSGASFSDNADADLDGDPLTVSALQGGTFDGTTFTKIGTYGHIHIDRTTGAYTYTLTKNQANVQALTKDQQVTDTFTYTISDGQGGFAQANITVTVFGTNDAPVVASTGTTFDMTKNLAAENGRLVFDGQFFFGDADLKVSDLDNGAVYGIAVIDVDNANGYWQYKLAGSKVWSTIPLDGVLLLSAADSVRFTGPANAAAEKLTFKAWDGTDGHVAGEVTQMPSTFGGSSAYSAGTYVVGAKNNAPAGVAGDPINLGLADPALGLNYTATVTVSDVPTDWILNGGTHNADGSWTVQTTNLASVSITTPTYFSGAVLLNVTASVVLADGTTTAISLGDNIEAYSSGSPIFAWSGDDFLTASSGNDLIVFSQPIGHDIVYSFDVAHDQIDLISYAEFTNFGEVQSRLSEDANGNALLTLSDGQSILLDGVHAAALTEKNFVFDQMPTLDNTTTMTISDGAFLPLTGTINNSGTIALNSTGGETFLQLIEYGVTLEGGGNIVLSDSDLNRISGTNSSVTLDNEDNAISGAGQLGDGELNLTNAGTINATGTHALVIDTGPNVIHNSGVLEASGAGGLTVLSAIENSNSGFLWANGANLTVLGTVTGTAPRPSTAPAFLILRLPRPQM